MSSSVSGLFDVLSQRLSWLNQKQGVIAENVANASTPGYKQLDVTPLTFGDAMKKASIGMAVTDPRHIVPPSMAGVNAKTFQSKDTAVSLSGNSVDLEQQMAEVSKNTVDYQMMTSVYHKMLALMKISIKGNAS